MFESVSKPMPLALRKFLPARDAMAAVEFAIILPLALTVLVAVFELSRELTQVRKIQLVANSIGQMISSSSTASLTADALTDIRDSAKLTFPDLLDYAKRRRVDWTQVAKITVVSIESSGGRGGQGVGSDYSKGTLLWAYGAEKGSWTCGKDITGINDNLAAPAPGSVPKSALSIGTIIVVNVKFQYLPLVNWTKMMVSRTFAVSAYYKPRNFRQIDVAPSESVTICSPPSLPT